MTTFVQTCPTYSKAYRASLPVAAELSQSLGVPPADALMIMQTLGSVMLSRARRGLMSGIPEIGIIHLAHRKNVVCTNLGKYIPNVRQERLKSQARLSLWVPYPLRVHLSEVAANAGTYNEQLKQLKQKDNRTTAAYRGRKRDRDAERAGTGSAGEGAGSSSDGGRASTRARTESPAERISAQIKLILAHRARSSKGRR